LILEALKKLERDKQVDDRGFLVMAAHPWPSGDARRYLIASLALTAFALTLVTAGGIWWWRHARVSAAPASVAAAAAPAKASTSVRPATAPAIALVEKPAAPAAVPAAPAPPPQSAPLPATTAEVLPVDEPAPAPESKQPASAARLSELRLSATSERDGRPVAILNDRMVYEGDVIDGIKVLRIEENAVEVEVGGEKRTLRF
jgi:hypothetical protein